MSMHHAGGGRTFLSAAKSDRNVRPPFTSGRWLGAFFIVALLSLPGAPPGIAQEPDPSADPALDFLVGSWRVSYTDRLLGKVEGYATARRSKYTGQLYLDYSVHHPKTKDRYRLDALSVKKTADAVVITLRGRVPSGATTPTGEPPAPRKEGATVLQATNNAIVRATLETETAETRVTDYQASENVVTLRFPLDPAKPQPGELRGTWTVVRHWSEGFRGQRIGERGQGKERVGAQELDAATMRGEETWVRPNVQIDSVTIAEMRGFGWLDSIRDQPGHKEDKRLDSAWLRVQGKDLPVNPGEKVEVKFLDPHIRYLDHARPDPKIPGALQIQVDIDKVTQPGPKELTLNGAPGQFEFDFPGLEPKEIRYMRKGRSEKFSAASRLFWGEVYYVEVEFPHQPYYSERWFMTQVKDRAPTAFAVKKTAGSNTVFRSRPFLLMDKHQFEPTAKELPDPKDPSGLHREALTIVRADPGETLQTFAADVLRPGMPVSVGIIEVAEMEREGRYARALELAKGIRQAVPDPERYKVKTKIIIAKPGEDRVTLVSLPDHAALILLHEELVRHVEKSIEVANRPLPAQFQPGGKREKEYLAKRKDYVRSLIDAARKLPDETPHLFVMEVTAPDESTMPLGRALNEETQKKFYPDTPEGKQKFFEFAMAKVAEAEGKLMIEAGQSLVELNDVNLSDMRQLLSVARMCYGRLAPGLIQDLVRRPAEGEPRYPRWVPDEAGRTAVRGLSDLMAAIAEDQWYAGFDKFAFMAMTFPLMFLTGPATGYASTIYAGEAIYGAQTALIAYDLYLAGQAVNRYHTARYNAKIARGVAEVAGADAYYGFRAEMKGAMFEAMFTGAGYVGVPLFLRAVNMGVRPTRAAMETAVREASRRGVERLGAATRADFEYVLGRAQYKAVHKGFQSLSDLEKAALKAVFRDGMPTTIAKRLNVPEGDTTVTVRPDPPEMANVSPDTISVPRLPDDLESSALRDSDDLVIDLRDTAPERSANPTMRQLYAEAQAAQSNGSPGANQTLTNLEMAEADLQRMNPEQRVVFEKAWTTFQKLRETNPDVAQLNEADAFKLMAFQSFGHKPNLPPTQLADPEDVVAFVLGWNRAPVTPAELARAADISETSAEAACLAAHNRLKRAGGSPWGAETPSSAGGVEEPFVPPASPHASTKPLPGAKPQSGSLDSATQVDYQERVAQVAKRLERMGMSPEKAEYAALSPCARQISLDVATAGAAWYHQLPPSKVMQVLGINRQQLKNLLHQYLQKLHWEPNALRRDEAIEKYLNGEAAKKLEPPPPPPPKPPPPPDAPMGLDAPPPPPSSVKQQVVDTLKRIGLDDAAIAKLRIDDVIQRVGPNPRAVAAGLARQLEVGAETVRNALKVNKADFADLLDRFDEAMLPFKSPAQRAEDLAHYLKVEADASAPLARVMEARIARANQALRDLGIPFVNPELLTKGLDIESAICGTAMDSGRVTAAQLMSRRSLSEQRLRQHLDEYLHYGRGVTDAKERAGTIKKFLDGKYAAPNAPWQPPSKNAAVVAARSDLQQALVQLGVPAVMAEQRAKSLAQLAERDAHQAIVAGAYHHRVPPAKLKEKFGLTPEQIAQKLDRYFEGMGMERAESRAKYIAELYFGKVDGPKPTPQEVSQWIGGAPPATTALRPVSTHTPDVPPNLSSPSPPVPPAPDAPKLKFGPNDWVYGPVAGGELRKLANRAGGKTLFEADKPAHVTDWAEFSKQTLNKAAASGRQVHFDLTHMQDLDGVLKGTGPYANKVTSEELRHIRDHWGDFQVKPKFYRNDVEVPPPFPMTAEAVPAPSVTLRPGVSKELVADLAKNGIKHSPENIVRIGRDPPGKIIFLETGNSKAGLQHIVERHGAEFLQKGVTQEQIPDLVIKAATEGKIVGHQGKDKGRPIYEVEFNGKTHNVAVTVGNNGFIVGANPK